MTIDRRALGKAFSAASSRYEAAAALQRSVRSELLERLPHFAISPKVIVDLGAGTGSASRELKQRYPRASLIAADLSLGMLQELRKNISWIDRVRRSKKIEAVSADAHQLPFRAGSVDLIFSSLMLQWCDLDRVFAEVRRVLAPEGLFVFSTFGVSTLQELRAAWTIADANHRVHTFFDMHDIGSALTRAGLKEPVLDVDRHYLRYPDPLSLMRSIKEIGAVNAAQDRPRGLTSPRTLQVVSDTYPRDPQRGDIVATWEVVYGATFGAPSPMADDSRDPSEVIVPFPSLDKRRGR